MSTFSAHQIIRVLPVFALLLAFLVVSPSIAQAQSRRATLHVTAVDSAQSGSTVEVVANLTEPDGAPIEGELIEFSMSVEFLSNSGEISIGSATTDELGVARIEFIPRAEGDHYLVASSSEESDVSAFSEIEISVTPGNQLYNELSPIRVPGANVWMTAAVLLAVWSVFVLVAIRIWQIARVGERDGGKSNV